MNYSLATTFNKIAEDTFQPYATLEATYGESLGDLTTTAVLLSITALGFSLTNDVSIASILKCGSYYDELKKFPVLTRVISDSYLNEWDRTNLLSLLARTV